MLKPNCYFLWLITAKNRLEIGQGNIENQKWWSIDKWIRDQCNFWKTRSHFITRFVFSRLKSPDNRFRGMYLLEKFRFFNRAHRSQGYIWGFFFKKIKCRIKMGPKLKSGEPKANRCIWGFSRCWVQFMVFCPSTIAKESFVNRLTSSKIDLK